MRSWFHLHLVLPIAVPTRGWRGFWFLLFINHDISASTSAYLWRIPKSKQIPQETFAVLRSVNRMEGFKQQTCYQLVFCLWVLCVGWIVSQLWIHGDKTVCQNWEEVGTWWWIYNSAQLQIIATHLLASECLTLWINFFNKQPVWEKKDWHDNLYI